MKKSLTMLNKKDLKLDINKNGFFLSMKTSIEKNVPKEFSESIPEDATYFEGIASTGDLNRNEYIIRPKAFKNSIEEFLSGNPVVLLQHDTNQPIGNVLWVKVVKNEVKIGGYIFDELTENRFSKGLFKALSTGHYTLAIEFENAETGEVISEEEFEKRAEEIGWWKMFDMGWKIAVTALEWIENSLVSIGSNRSSLITKTNTLESYFTNKYGDDFKKHFNETPSKDESKDNEEKEDESGEKEGGSSEETQKQTDTDKKTTEGDSEETEKGEDNKEEEDKTSKENENEKVEEEEKTKQENVDDSDNTSTTDSEKEGEKPEGEAAGSEEEEKSEDEEAEKAKGEEESEDNSINFEGLDFEPKKDWYKGLSLEQLAEGFVRILNFAKGQKEKIEDLNKIVENTPNRKGRATIIGNQFEEEKGKDNKPTEKELQVKKQMNSVLKIVKQLKR